MTSNTLYRRPPRSGFTLTELLIAITIIGLLVGLLAVAGGGVLRAARETAVTSEITQMSGSIENFRSKFGFYPPSFEQFKRTVNTGDDAPIGIVQAEANQLLPFLNKISANHQELSLSPISSRASQGYRRIDDWWEFVGCNLDQTTSLQFWLSGLCLNKQFPLTNGLVPPAGNPNAYLPVAYNASIFLDGTDIASTVERDVLFDFDAERLVFEDILVGSAGVINRPVARYIMDYGKTNGDLFYVYRDAASYLPVTQPGGGNVLFANERSSSAMPALPAPPFGTPAYQTYLASPNHRGLAYHTVEGAGSIPNFVNPNTFQLISFGLDGDAGVPSVGQEPSFPTTAAEANLVRGLLTSQMIASDDNLCNFATGRLDKFKTDNEVQ